MRDHGDSFSLGALFVKPLGPFSGTNCVQTAVKLPREQRQGGTMDTYRYRGHNGLRVPAPAGGGWGAIRWSVVPLPCPGVRVRALDGMLRWRDWPGALSSSIEGTSLSHIHDGPRLRSCASSRGVSAWRDMVGLGPMRGRESLKPTYLHEIAGMRHGHARAPDAGPYTSAGTSWVWARSTTRQTTSVSYQ